MRCVFMGTPQFAVVSLKGLISSKHEVLSVVTIPDKPMGRGQKIGVSAVKQFANENSIPVLQPETLIEESFIRQIQSYNADIFIVVAFKILPKIIFSLPKYGTINLHASLLPKYRGAAPINWAIMNGEKETGVTTILIDEKVDTGDILLQRKIPIAEDMTAGELHDQLAEIGMEVLIDSIDKLGDNAIQPIPQTNEKASKAPKLTKEMTKIDFIMNAEKVHNQIRGLSPYPGAYCHFREKTIKFLRSSREELPLKIQNKPGKVYRVNKDYFILHCGEGGLGIREVQPEGKKKMSAKEFINGTHLDITDKFH